MLLLLMAILFELVYGTYTNQDRLSSDAMLVEIVAHSKDFYFSIFGNGFRISTQDTIKKNGGCSKFVVYRGNTAIIQGKKRLCKSKTTAGVDVCGTMNANTWRVLRYKGKEYVKFKYPNENKCITATKMSDVNGRKANIQECIDDSGIGDISQRFVINRLY
ncbi:hypothetical protein HK407_09g15480 [Ordospora pajunii]|uniref:uncharacterized protein n=1 Tax=Ordospora pajunii TaxID=3039483 RepID=UPI0029526991|nr:uncharacterized protein HK407_09g15480 [Ordospora pajunii]KAH9410862.1 hypothetical protein HK407_09g15480 [Ordospora pajunii]